MAESLSGKVAIVTGGASGFGEAIAERFVESGARVLIVDINESNGSRVAERLGGSVDYCRADVSVEAEVIAAVEQASRRFGRLDIVVNNAGVASPRVAIEAMEEALFDRLFDVNVKSVYLFCRHAVPLLRQVGGGSIINTASTSALKPRALNAGYASSKAAVLTLTKALAVELAADNIRVNALTPVASDTPLFRDFLGDQAERAKAEIEAAIPLGRLGSPADMAACAVFLASDEARFLTGISLPVDGGWTAT
ncbi:MAG: SDR family oxidoreductase [Pseudomonadota bacterium]|jgi:3-oxoacyl-[acyl-carrier protein] reductase|nr:SDR family oxidoreductase [Pseudomonadota bacterium]